MKLMPRSNEIIRTPANRNRKRLIAAHLVETLRSPSYKFFAPLQSRPDQQFSPSYNMETVLKPFPHVPQHSPWLVFFSHGKRRRTQTFFSIVDGRSYVKSIPQLSRKTCLLFSHGCLLMTGPETEDCFLCHPTTMKTIQLPPLPLENQFPYDNVRCFLSSAPTDPNCVILLAACFKPQIMFCPLSQNTWRKVEYELDNDPGGLYNLVTCNGKLYGMTYDGMLVVVDFDLDPNVLMIEEIPEPSACLMTSRWDRSLVESSGEIFLVYTELTRNTCNVVTFNIYKLDLLEKKWVAVQSIGDKAFFYAKPIQYHARRVNLELGGAASTIFAQKILACTGLIGVYALPALPKFAYTLVCTILDFLGRVMPLSHCAPLAGVSAGVKVLHMAESDGELITVFTDKFGDKVRIQKLDPLKNQWKDIDTIGGRSLIAGCRSSIHVLFYGGKEISFRCKLLRF